MFEVGRLVARIVLEGGQAFGRELNKIKSEWKGLGDKGTEASRDLGRAGIAVGLAITAIGVAAAKTGIEYNALQQRSRAALKTLLGSAQAANAQMDKLDEFARTSPFAKGVFIKAQQQMLAFGIETKKVIPYLGAIQDAIAAAGGTNVELARIVNTISQIQSSAKITAQDLNEFGNAGIDAAALIGSQMGKTGAQIREEISKGTLGAEEALDALVAGMKERFGGAAANVKQTWDGAVDRLKAAWRDFASSLAEPLVGTEGGGALTGLLNWAADALRMFLALPGPIRGMTTGVVAAAGAVALLGGAFLLGVPKVAEYRAALATLGTTAHATSTALSFVAKGIGLVSVALAAISVGFGFLDQWLTKLQATDAELKNLARTAESAEVALAGASKGLDVAYWGEVDLTISGVKDALAAAAASAESWIGFMNMDVGQGGVLATLKQYGEGLRLLADEDLPAAQAAFQRFTVEYQLNTTEQWRALQQMPAYKEALVGAADQLGLTADKATLLKLATGELTPVTDSNRLAQEEATGAYQTETGAVMDLATQMELLTQKVLEANDVGMQAVSANVDYQAALANTEAHIAAVTAGTEGYSMGLDENTAMGRANIEMLITEAAKAQDAALKQYALDGSTEGLSRRLAEGRQRLYDHALALSGDAARAQELTDKIYSIPPTRTTTVTVNTWDARASLDALLAAYQNRTISLRAYIHAVEGQSEGGIRFYREGGIEHYARGGRHGLREQHVAQIARAGVARVWNEPETEGEVYIPLARRKRERSTAYLGTVADMFGYDLVKRGGAPTGGSSMTKFAPSTAMQHVTEVIELQVDGRTLARTIREYDRSIS